MHKLLKDRTFLIVSALVAFLLSGALWRHFGNDFFYAFLMLIIFSLSADNRRLRKIINATEIQTPKR